jgi:energy-coupling factor transporter ATP-binding protein EcfA2
MARPLLDLTGAVFRTPGGLLRVGALRLAGPGLVAVVGPNGGGKSTLLRCLSGLHPRIDGAARSRGANSAPRLALRIMLQHPEWQLHAATVRLQLGTSSPRVDRAVERFRLGPLLDVSPYHLSSGERRRVMLAAMLASEAAVLLLDEPTAGLDAPGRHEMMRAVRDFSADRLVVAATHDWMWIAQDADRALWVENLAIVEDGSPRKLADRLAADDGPDLRRWVVRLQAEGCAVASWWDPQALAAEIVAAGRALS